MATAFFAYHQVSTDRQGASGLEFDAQRQAVAGFAANGDLMAQFTDTESGGSVTNRPHLPPAQEECRRRRAVFPITRLDRLARDVAFIAHLMKSAVDFIGCDMPQTARFTIHILAVVAEHEREMISKRRGTEAALAEGERRGTELGNPCIEEARARAVAVHHAKRPAPEVFSLRLEWRTNGKMLCEIANHVNRLKIRSAPGHQWYASIVRNQLENGRGNHEA